VPKLAAGSASNPVPKLAAGWASNPVPKLAAGWASSPACASLQYSFRRGTYAAHVDLEQRSAPPIDLPGSTFDLRTLWSNSLMARGVWQLRG
jgi:hypothetical protein